VLPDVDFNEMSYDEGHALVKEALSLAELKQGIGDAASGAKDWLGQQAGRVGDWAAERGITAAGKSVLDKVNQYPNLRNIAIGTAGGAGLGALSTLFQPRRRRGDWVGRTLTGGLLGGVGAGLGSALYRGQHGRHAESQDVMNKATTEAAREHLVNREAARPRFESEPGIGEPMSGREWALRRGGVTADPESGEWGWDWRNMQPLEAATDVFTPDDAVTPVASAVGASLPWLDKVPILNKLEAIQRIKGRVPTDAPAFQQGRDVMKHLGLSPAEADKVMLREGTHDAVNKRWRKHKKQLKNLEDSRPQRMADSAQAAKKVRQIQKQIDQQLKTGAQPPSPQIQQQLYEAQQEFKKIRDAERLKNKEWRRLSEGAKQLTAGDKKDSLLRKFRGTDQMDMARAQAQRRASKGPSKRMRGAASLGLAALPPVVDAAMQGLRGGPTSITQRLAEAERKANESLQ